MENKYTTNDLILFIYRETSPAKSASIKKAIETDPVLKKKYLELKKGHGLLNAATVKPKAKTVDNILRYSRSMSSILSPC